MLFLELKLDTFRAPSRMRADEAFAVLAYFTLHPLGEIGERCAIGLAHILSRDLRPARVRHVNRATPVYCATADHGHLNCYGDFHYEESF